MCFPYRFNLCCSFPSLTLWTYCYYFSEIVLEDSDDLFVLAGCRKRVEFSGVVRKDVAR